MDLEEYQEKASFTDISPHTIEYYILALNEEAGEVAGQWKKYLRDDIPMLQKKLGIDPRGYVPYERLDKLTKEMGDVLWYLSQLARKLNISLNYIASENLDKLKKRAEEGKLHGEGSNR